MPQSDAKFKSKIHFPDRTLLFFLFHNFNIIPPKCLVHDLSKI